MRTVTIKAIEAVDYGSGHCDGRSKQNETGFFVNMMTVLHRSGLVGGNTGPFRGPWNDRSTGNRVNPSMSRGGKLWRSQGDESSRGEKLVQKIALNRGNQTCILQSCPETQFFRSNILHQLVPPVSRDHTQLPPQQYTGDYGGSLWLTLDSKLYRRHVLRGP
jgi:hypothetical protein